MIHRRNATITAVVIAAIITTALWLFPRLYHGAVGWLYLPNLVILAFIAHFFNNNSIPPDFVGWCTAAAYTVLYLIIFLIIYVAVLEFYLLRSVLDHLDRAKQHVKLEAPDSNEALNDIGQAVVELESRRRRHFLLKKMDFPELPSQQKQLFGAYAIAHYAGSGPTKAILKRLKSKMAAESNSANANLLITKLRNDARAVDSGSPSGASSVEH